MADFEKKHHHLFEVTYVVSGSYDGGRVWSKGSPETAWVTVYSPSIEMVAIALRQRHGWHQHIVDIKKATYYGTLKVSADDEYVLHRVEQEALRA